MKKMFQIQKFEESIRVPPKYIGLDIKESVKKSLAERYENKVLKDIGVILAINKIDEIGNGKIIIEDAGVYYKTSFDALVYIPKLYEIVVGEVVDITNFGVFVRFGPIDGLCHVSQVINDYVSFEEKSRALFARDSRKTLKVGDYVKARIIAVSLNKKEVNKINITMRQPNLGALAWIAEEREAKLKAQAKTGK
ncbi:MAG: DNA-directed RNA polymerase [archaeon]|nr:DNA-directed RNA polymerase [archaeon]